MRTRWRRSTLVLEALRSGAALLAAGFLALLTPLLSPWQILLLPLCALFASQVASCGIRWMSEVIVDETGVSVRRGFLATRRIPWDETTGFALRVFALGRRGNNLLRDIKLTGDGVVLLIDDGVEDFPALLARIWDEARSRGVGISDATRANLVHAGLATAEVS